jgi:two-component system cell cycle sensor histidine kinase/response regulator CckA
MSSPLRILLVEDNVADAMLVERELTRTHPGVLTRRVEDAPSLTAALEEFRPDVVLADFRLPTLEGLEVVRLVRAAAPTTPVIIVTGTLDEETAAECIKRGAADYVLKDHLTRLDPAVRGALALKQSQEERTRAEAAVRANEGRFRALIEHSADAIALFAADGTILYGSPATTRVLGYPLADFVGHNAYEFVHPEDRGSVVERLARVAQEEGRSEAMSARIRHRDGTWRMLEGVFTNLLPDPNVGAIVSNYRDVTERLRLEQQLRQAQKMEAVGRLAGGVAHDFNNILTAIMGSAELLLEDLPEGHPRREDATEISRAARRAADLTRQLLAFSRQQVLAPKVVDLGDIVRNVEPMLRRLIGENIALHAVLAPDLGAVRADPGQIEQVILNLAVNARDAMPRGGKLTIETANVDLDQSYAREHSTVQSGPYVMLAVTDSGVGMDETTRAHLFEPFYTTKEFGRGTGLGLATVYGIVKQSEGYIWVYSEPNHGATFKIYLPRVDAPAEPMRPAEAATRARHLGTETILLVEDEQLVRTLVHKVLGQQGYTVLEAPAGEEALAVAAAYAGEIHLLVTDVVMPGVGGRELAHRLAQDRPRTRVLYLSGYSDDAIGRHGMLDPGTFFLQKPFTPAVLVRKVREVLDSLK